MNCDARSANGTSAPPYRAVCVFAGSSAGVRPSYVLAARQLGRLLATRSITLVYGGARIGLMGAVADAALEAGGHVVGIIPRSLVSKEVAHEGLTELHVVASMHERKALMAERAEAFIALPGGLGTWEEVLEVATWGQLGLHAKPCGLLDVDGYYDHLMAFVAHAVAEGFLRGEHAHMIAVERDPVKLLERLASYDAPTTAKWIDSAST